jgi:hypothetical protein
MEASYVTPAAQQMAGEAGDWWFWLETPAGIYHGLTPAEPAAGEGMLRLRPAENARKEVKESRAGEANGL